MKAVFVPLISLFCAHAFAGRGVEVRHESRRTLVVSSVIGFGVEGKGMGDIFLDDFCGTLNLRQPGQSTWCRQLNTERNFNRKPVSLWFRETQGAETRESKERPWVYLSQQSKESAPVAK